MDVVLRKGYLGEGFGEGNVRDLTGPGGWRMTGSAEKCFSMNGVAVQRTPRGAKTSEA